MATDWESEYTEEELLNWGWEQGFGEGEEAYSLRSQQHENYLASLEIGEKHPLDNVLWHNPDSLGDPMWEGSGHGDLTWSGDTGYMFQSNYSPDEGIYGTKYRSYADCKGNVSLANKGGQDIGHGMEYCD